MTQFVFGVDMGGSAIKAGAVDLTNGTLNGPLTSVPTPRPSTPGALVDVLRALVATHTETKGRLGVAFPSVIAIRN